MRKNSEDLIDNKLADRNEFMESYNLSSLDELIISKSIDRKITILASNEVTIIDQSLDKPKKYIKIENKLENIERQVLVIEEADIPNKINIRKLKDRI